MKSESLVPCRYCCSAVVVVVVANFILARLVQAVNKPNCWLGASDYFFFCYVHTSFLSSFSRVCVHAVLVRAAADAGVLAGALRSSSIEI